MSEGINLFEAHLETVPQRTLPTRKEEIKRIIEGLLFSSSEPLTLDRLRDVIETAMPLKRSDLRDFLLELKEEYLKQRRGFEIVEVAEGYLVRTVADLHPFIETLHRQRRVDRLSRAATEVLAIIAYKQPITRAEIDSIRGVDCTGSVQALLERGLIQVVGRKETIGRPSQYGVTTKFLQTFGLKNLDELRTRV